MVKLSTLQKPRKINNSKALKKEVRRMFQQYEEHSIDIAIGPDNQRFYLRKSHNGGVSCYDEPSCWRPIKFSVVYNYVVGHNLMDEFMFHLEEIILINV
jgi:hypothetical protein